jgi:anti-sigma factor RsiW
MANSVLVFTRAAQRSLGRMSAQMRTALADRLEAIAERPPPAPRPPGRERAQPADR